MVLVLEGGYNLTSIAVSAEACLATLMGVCASVCRVSECVFVCESVHVCVCVPACVSVCCLPVVG